MQLETGIYFNKLDSYNQSLVHSNMLRFGLFKRCEFRLVIEEGMENNQYYHSDASGLYPLAVCSKIALVKEKGIIPAITVSGYLRLPFTSTKNFTPGYYSSTGILVFQHTLGENLILAYNAGITRSGDDAAIYFPVTTVVSYALTNTLSVFGEYYAFYQQKTLPSNNVDFGFLFLVKPQMQLDVDFGTTVMKNVHSNYLTLGFSYRFRPLRTVTITPMHFGR